MLDPARLGVEVQHADGRSTRWAGDEPDAAYVPVNVDFSTSMPGGFKDASLALARRIERDYPDLNLLDTVRIYGPGNETVWEGRAHALPRRSGVEGGVVQQSVGWAAHMKDDPAFRQIFIDRDLNAWGGGTNPRIQLLLAFNQDHEEHQMLPDATGARIATGITGQWARSRRSEVWYDAGVGEAIGSVWYEWTRAANVNSGDANWSWSVNLSDSDTPGVAGATEQATAELRAAGPGSGTLNASNAIRRWAYIKQAYATGPAGAAGEIYRVMWRAIVFGNHGIAKQGSGWDQGLLASDMIRYALAEAAPLLDLTDIEPTTYPIPHAAFRDFTTAEEVVLRLNAYHLWEWGVWENRRFFFRPPDPTRRVWDVRRSEGAAYDLEGDQADDLYNGVVVIYNRGDGIERIAGPTDSRTFDVESDLLRDTSDTNPVNMHGIPRKWAILRLSMPTTDDGAVVVGAAWLAEHALAPRRGAVTLTGTVKGAGGIERPAWAVRAGDSIRLADHSSDITRRVIETRYSGDGRAVVCSLDNGSTKLDAILERMGVAQIGVM